MYYKVYNVFFDQYWKRADAIRAELNLPLSRLDLLPCQMASILCLDISSKALLCASFFVPSLQYLEAYKLPSDTAAIVVDI